MFDALNVLKLKEAENLNIRILLLILSFGVKRIL